MLKERLLTLCCVELAARTPPSGYCQFVPPRDAGGAHFTRHGPPALPPHLLQSVLNADLPEHVSCSCPRSLFLVETFFIIRAAEINDSSHDESWNIFNDYLNFSPYVFYRTHVT